MQPPRQAIAGRACRVRSSGQLGGVCRRRSAISGLSNPPRPQEVEQMVPISKLAREAYEAFTTTQRDDRAITTTRDDAPDWVNDLVRKAHGDFLPDDWRYDCIRSALEHIAGLDAETERELEDEDHQFADGYVDIYTSELTAWLASNNQRVAYVNEGVEELGAAAELDEDKRLMLGQYHEASEVWGSVVRSLV